MVADSQAMDDGDFCIVLTVLIIFTEPASGDSGCPISKLARLLNALACCDIVAALVGTEKGVFLVLTSPLSTLRGQLEVNGEHVHVHVGLTTPLMRGFI